MQAVEVIQAALSERIRRNPRYSLRAFARATGVSPTVLSLVLSGKRKLSKKAGARLAEALSLDPSSRAALLRASAAAAVPTDTPSYAALSLDRFHALADWQHWGVLSALELPRARLTPQWMSRRLGLTVTEARVAIDRLKRLGMVELREGRWRQAIQPIRMDNAESTAATRRFHEQLLTKALESLEKDPPETRDFSSITLAMDPALIPYAKSRIREFRRELARELESRSEPREVYHLSVQIFPLSVPPSPKKRSP